MSSSTTPNLQGYTILQTANTAAAATAAAKSPSTPGSTAPRTAVAADAGSSAADRPGSRINHDTLSSIDLSQFESAVDAIMVRPVAESEENDLTSELQVSKERRNPVGASEFRGVTRHRRSGRLEAHIWDSKKQVHLGSFDDAAQAAKAHDIMSIRTRGIKARINFKATVYESLMKWIGRPPNLSKEDVVKTLKECPSQQCPGKKHRRVLLHQISSPTSGQSCTTSSPTASPVVPPGTPLTSHNSRGAAAAAAAAGGCSSWNSSVMLKPLLQSKRPLTAPTPASAAGAAAAGWQQNQSALQKSWGPAAAAAGSSSSSAAAGGVGVGGGACAGAWGRRGGRSSVTSGLEVTAGGVCKPRGASTTKTKPPSLPQYKISRAAPITRQRPQSPTLDGVPATPSVHDYAGWLETLGSSKPNSFAAHLASPTQDSLTRFAPPFDQRPECYFDQGFGEQGHGGLGPLESFPDHSSLEPQADQGLAQGLFPEPQGLHVFGLTGNELAAVSAHGLQGLQHQKLADVAAAAAGSSVHGTQWRSSDSAFSPVNDNGVNIGPAAAAGQHGPYLQHQQQQCAATLQQAGGSAAAAAADEEDEEGDPDVRKQYQEWMSDLPGLNDP